MSEESARVRPEQSGQDDASAQDVGHREHAELVNGVDGVLSARGGLSAALDVYGAEHDNGSTQFLPQCDAVDGANHTVHGTEPCTDPQCTTQRPHGHICPRCGPGTYDIIADLDG